MQDWHCLSTNCYTANSYEIISNNCDGKQKCTITASTPFFGKDDCLHVSKYINVTYQCILKGDTIFLNI